MKTRLFMMVSLVAVILASCAPASEVTPTKTIIPLLTSTLTSPPPINKLKQFWVAPEPVTCGEYSDANGRILFLKQSSGYDLHVMNGHGCFHRVVLENVFGSPSWSNDGKMIAIGCDDQKYICIIDANKTLPPCFELKEDGEVCDTTILNKIKIPTDKSVFIYSAKFSYDNSKISINGEYADSNIEFVNFLSLLNSGEWKTIIESSAGSLHPAMSPVKNEVAINGVYIISLDEDIGINKVFVGGSPAWSSDGLKIAYLTSAFSKDGKTTIAEYNLREKKVTLLYEPIVLDEDYSPRVNIRIRDILGGGLSWSPNNQYIVFSAVYRHDNDSQIFRLDTTTGELVSLTTRFETKEGQQYYFAPAWGH